MLKNKNKKTSSVLWNSIKITDKQLDENYQHIKDFDSNSIHNGYFCSTFEPFLCLLCELFCISIQHNFNGTIIYYSIQDSRKTCKFKSDSGHFWNE